MAAVCIEDKLFPKTNSFIGSERQPLATIDEFTGKIKAVKDAQSGSRLLSGCTARGITSPVRGAR